ncbi:DMT family transporter [Microvirga lotononidis]|uniref:DMT(Drug/metabolite transporter) superfamily permease n=1 Tax=Microvirga lotononidis TaxID=864069 RepID=I4YM83_9HYPH|nr:DMT family transporter [Microvirga lotononidis]EIM25075.1 DMT(drug/metabolite transporter) superfamily permease [Microvirga lotononidis]WQO29435.1 DMT family transporter [Microvirga lotononidis]
MSTASGEVATLPAAPTPAFMATNLLVCSMLWSTSFLFIKLSGSINPFVLASIRGLIGASALALWFVVQAKSFRPDNGQWHHWVVLGALNGWIPNVLVAHALTQIGTAPAAMIQASGPLLVAVLSHLLYADERLTPRRFVGVVIGLAGMGILIGPTALPDSGISPWGALTMVATALSYAAANLYVRSIRHADPARLALGQQICSGIPATTLALVVAGPSAFAAVPGSAASLLALGIVSTALPILLFMRLIRRAGPTRASMVGYLQPVWTTIMAVLFLGESIGLRELTGGVVVLTGVALVSFSGRVKAIR